MLADDGRGLLYLPILNYSDGNSDSTREMILHPAAVLGLADGGAHVGTICDASMPTWMLTHWVRDRTRGERLPLELIVPAPDQRHRPPLRARRPRRARSRATWPTST